MTSKRFTSSRPADCVLPRSDAGYKPHRDGPLQGMDYPEESWTERFSRRFALFAIGLAAVPAAYHFALTMGWIG